MYIDTLKTKIYIETSFREQQYFNLHNLPEHNSVIDKFIH